MSFKSFTVSSFLNQSLFTCGFNDFKGACPSLNPNTHLVVHFKYVPQIEPFSGFAWNTGCLIKLLAAFLKSSKGPTESHNFSDLISYCSLPDSMWLPPSAVLLPGQLPVCLGGSSHSLQISAWTRDPMEGSCPQPHCLSHCSSSWFRPSLLCSAFQHFTLLLVSSWRSPLRCKRREPGQGYCCLLNHLQQCHLYQASCEVCWRNKLSSHGTPHLIPFPHLPRSNFVPSFPCNPR